MSYVIAFSIEGAKDVSKRYIRDPSKQLPRNRIDEDALTTLLTLLTINSRATLTEGERDDLEDQDQLEWAELESYSTGAEVSEQAKEAALPRQSGSVDWKRERGENGKQ